MNSLKSFNLNTKFFYFLVFSIFVVILMRNSALYPSVFADEHIYSSSSRLFPIEQSSVSNYLYLKVYSFTNICRDGFLSCARIINCLFFVGAIPFIYQITKRSSNKNIARWVCILVMLSPINIYTAFFMPEAMYFFSFWLLAWYLLLYVQDTKWINASILGILIAFCSLIKPHGFFLLIPTFVYLGFIARNEGMSFYKFFFIITLISASFILFKFLLGYLLAGSAGLTLLGHTYSASTGDFLNAVATQSGPPEALADQSLSSRLTLLLSGILNFQSNFWNFLYLWFLNLKGHVLSAFLLFGVPIFIFSKIFFELDPHKFARSRYCKNLALLSLIFVVFLILFSSLYSGLMGQASGERSIWRLHERYYNFTFPLFYIGVGAFISNSSTQALDGGKSYIFKQFYIALFLCLIIGWACMTSLHPYQPTSIDSPELRGFIANRYFFIGCSIASIILIIGILCRQFWAKWTYFFLMVPITLVVGSLYVNSNMWERVNPDSFDRAGIVAKKLLSKSDIDQLVVVGENPIELSRVIFYLSNPHVISQTIKGGSVYETSMLPKGKTTALVMDRYSVSNNFSNIRLFDGFSIVGGHNEIVVNFDAQHWPSKELISESGLFTPPEPWGAWSIGHKASMEFRQPLPEKFDLMLMARAFGPSIGKSFRIEVGGLSQNFTLGDEFEVRNIKVSNPAKSRIINIYIPAPASPKMLGIGDDERMLGIALREVKVTW